MSLWQLCLANCPHDQRIDYKQALSSDDRWPRTTKLQLDSAAALCRAHNLTDFFFDACVFDLMTSNGDLTFRDVAKLALDDIRRHYQPYAKHYEMKRSSLTPYSGQFSVGEEAHKSASVRESHFRSGASNIVFYRASLLIIVLVFVTFSFYYTIPIR